MENSLLLLWAQYGSDFVLFSFGVVLGVFLVKLLSRGQRHNTTADPLTHYKLMKLILNDAFEFYTLKIKLEVNDIGAGEFAASEYINFRTEFIRFILPILRETKITENLFNNNERVLVRLLETEFDKRFATHYIESAVVVSEE